MFVRFYGSQCRLSTVITIKSIGLNDGRHDMPLHPAQLLDSEPTAVQN